MTALIVLVFFAFFVGLDWFLHHRKSAEATTQPATAAVTQAPPAELPEPVFVAGYELPEGLHYHRGHTWARVLTADTVAVGIDDFARRLIGTPTAVHVPRVGSWVRQGAPAAEVDAADRLAALLAPVEGEVIEINRDLEEHPELVARDPYGQGWLYKVQSAALATGVRNLMSGTLAQRFTEDARDQLDLRLMALSGSVLQDGGEPAPDFADHLETDDWRRLIRTFLLTH